jgi:fatty acid desaturase
MAEAAEDYGQQLKTTVIWLIYVTLMLSVLQYLLSILRSPAAASAVALYTLFAAAYFFLLAIIFFSVVVLLTIYIAWSVGAALHDYDIEGF